MAHEEPMMPSRTHSVSHDLFILSYLLVCVLVCVLVTFITTTSWVMEILQHAPHLHIRNCKICKELNGDCTHRVRSDCSRPCGGGLRTRNRVIEVPRSMELIWIDSVTTMQWWSRKCTSGTRISLVNVSAVTLDAKMFAHLCNMLPVPKNDIDYSYHTIVDVAHQHIIRHMLLDLVGGWSQKRWLSILWSSEGVWLQVNALLRQSIVHCLHCNAGCIDKLCW